MKRFVFVNTGGPVIHRHYGKLVEGERMACGRRVRPGWLWFRSDRKKDMTVCKQCDK